MPRYEYRCKYCDGYGWVIRDGEVICENRTRTGKCENEEVPDQHPDTGNLGWHPARPKVAVWRVGWRTSAGYRLLFRWLCPQKRQRVFILVNYYLWRRKRQNHNPTRLYQSLLPCPELWNAQIISWKCSHQYSKKDKRPSAIPTYSCVKTSVVTIQVPVLSTLYGNCHILTVSTLLSNVSKMVTIINISTFPVHVTKISTFL